MSSPLRCEADEDFINQAIQPGGGAATETFRHIA